MNEFDPHRYTITVKRVLEDEEPFFKATVRELPHVSEYGDTHNEVYELAIDAINGLRDMSREMGHHFPDPAEEDENFSGRVTLRMPKSLHRSASNIADDEGVSLNQFLVATIGEKVGGAQMYLSAADHISRQLASSVRHYPITPHVLIQQGTATQPRNVFISGTGPQLRNLHIGGTETVSTEDTEIVPTQPGFLHWEHQRNG